MYVHANERENRIILREMFELEEKGRKRGVFVYGSLACWADVSVCVNENEREDNYERDVRIEGEG